LSIFEFQVSAGSFLAMQRNVLRSRRICLPGPIPVGPAQIVLDRLEFGANALRHNVADDFAVFHTDHGPRGRAVRRGLPYADRAGLHAARHDARRRDEPSQRRAGDQRGVHRTQTSCTS
jgi:hypothetical protein